MLLVVQLAAPSAPLRPALAPRARSAAMPSCCAGGVGHGPGFATPLEAHRHGERERLAYIPVTSFDHARPDYLATVDLDPSSPTHAQVIHRLPMPHLGDELHHSGWNACSSCYGDARASRSRLVLPALGSSRIYAVDVATDPRKPRLDAEVSPAHIAAQTGLATAHTSHCLGDGTIMVSFMGDEAGEPRGGFVLFDQSLKLLQPWAPPERYAPFGYDFWYQPRQGVMVSSGWGAPAAFSRGFDPADVAKGRYASALYVWDWRSRELAQTLPLGADGAVPLEVRFLHDPGAAVGFVGAALASNVLRFRKLPPEPGAPPQPQHAVGTWAAEVAIRQESVPVSGWALPSLPPLITDILISLDDRFLFLSNWLRGDVCMYDISEPLGEPRLVGQVWLGGVIRAGGGVTVTGGPLQGAQPAAPRIRGQELVGGPQMLQLSLDGRRLYVTSSLYSPWDAQFYPESRQRGSWLLRLDVDTERGGLSLDTSPETGLFVDFGAEPDGPGLAHEIRFPGGDSTSDIWY